VPWGILIGGEELHNNHHAYGTSAKLSSRWYEFDLGWTYIRISRSCGSPMYERSRPKLRVGSAAESDSRLRNASDDHRESLRGRLLRMRGRSRRPAPPSSPTFASAPAAPNSLTFPACGA
jgi:hypothetical protein